MPIISDLASLLVLRTQAIPANTPKNLGNRLLKRALTTPKCSAAAQPLICYLRTPSCVHVRLIH